MRCTSWRNFLVGCAVAALLVVPSLAPAAIFWTEEFNPGDLSSSPPTWGTRGEAGGRYTIVDLGDALGDPSLSGESGIEVKTDGHAAMYADRRTDRTRGSRGDNTVGYPNAGETRYLYFWGVHVKEGDARVNVGLDMGDVFGNEMADGFGYTRYLDSDTVIHRFNNGSVGVGSMAGGGAADYDHRIVLDSPSGDLLDVTFQTKSVSSSTWDTTHTENTDVNTVTGQLVFLGTDSGRFFVDAIEFSERDGTSKIPEPGTLVLMVIGGLCWIGRRR
jgi:hypothetical protein